MFSAIMNFFICGMRVTYMLSYLNSPDLTSKPSVFPLATTSLNEEADQLSSGEQHHLAISVLSFQMPHDLHSELGPFST